MSTVNQALAQGTRLHQAGRLPEAEQAYRQVLSVEPGHPHALHQMGLLALQARQFEAAIDWIGQAVRADKVGDVTRQSADGLLSGGIGGNELGLRIDERPLRR